MHRGINRQAFVLTRLGRFDRLIVPARNVKAMLHLALLSEFQVSA